MPYFRSFFSLAGAIAGLVISLSSATSAFAQEPDSSASAVAVSFPVEREVVDYKDFVGHTAARDSIDFKARVSGFLEKINFNEGALVRKGDVLFEIDPRPYQLQVDLASAQLAANEALLKRAQAANARTRELSSKGVISEQEVLENQTEVDRASANMVVSRASLELSKLNLNYTRIIAPIDGRMGRSLLSVGSLIQENEDRLATIVSIGPIYAYFDVDEVTLLKLSKQFKDRGIEQNRVIDWPVAMKTNEKSDFAYEGRVNFVDNQVNPETGLIRMRAIFPNDDDQLIPGLFINLRLPVAAPRTALLISGDAIFSVKNNMYVHVVDEQNKVTRRQITVGNIHDRLQVVESGLKKGDQVVVRGGGKLKPGTVVQKTLVEMPLTTPVTQVDSPVGLPVRKVPNEEK